LADARRVPADGFGQLRDAITRSGGIDRWLAEFDLPEPHHCRGTRTWWTDERIEAELRRFAAGQEVFRHAASSGGPERLRSWARRTGTAGWCCGQGGSACPERYSGRVSAAV
jgi:hypothetical protein